MLLVLKSILILLCDNFFDVVSIYISIFASDSSGKMIQSIVPATIKNNTSSIKKKRNLL